MLTVTPIEAFTDNYIWRLLEHRQVPVHERAGVNPANSVGVFVGVRAWKDNF